MNGSGTVSTYTPKPGEIARNWHVIDADNIVLGRLAAQIATLLRGTVRTLLPDHDVTQHEWCTGYRWDIVLTGAHRTLMEPEGEHA